MHDQDFFEFNNKTVLVTGSSRGIGLEIAETFLKYGSNVVFNGTNSFNLKEALKNKPLERSHAVNQDVTLPVGAKSLVDKSIEKFGKLDILICNVGSGQSKPPGEENYDEWLRMMSLNLYSATNVIQHALKYLDKSSGSIVCISSICGQEVIANAPLAYSAAKAALNSYIRGSARPFGKKGVRINGISPGNINFPGSTWEKKISQNPNEINKLINRDVALRRFGSPSDVANLALWLSSKFASFVTGNIYVIDGGQVNS